ncbi:MAG TPA: NAD(P)-binding protein [Polyangiales bacterium]|nr:NAD(P)-binding protein [Polyangiales bacterium]
MDSVRTLIIGAGMSGLACAAFSRDSDYLVLERDAEIGGYCKTVKQDGFVWDYSGHFFHFKNKDIADYLHARMPTQSVLDVEKRSFIHYRGQMIDFPFQKNIHQLPKDELIECLVDLYFARLPGQPPQPENNFEEMLYARFGRGIAEKFLIPYNEKLYACRLSSLDKNAMGRFFPHADLTDIIRNMRTADNSSYNANFTYPEGGAIEYVKAIASEVRQSQIALSERLVSIDLERRLAKTNKRELKYERLISSAPFDKLLAAAGLLEDKSVWSWNKVLVFNLGFDKKGPENVHWMYYPDRSLCFYRVGFYDNIFNTPRMSLYVEIGYPAAHAVDQNEIELMLRRTLSDLGRAGVVSDHELVSHHSVVLDPAYVHITERSIKEHKRLKEQLASHGVHTLGRYGGWTYCSIEDNVIEARALMEQLA